jgi:hypothetical protein
MKKGNFKQLLLSLLQTTFFVFVFFCLFLCFVVLSFTHLLFISIQEIDKSTIKYVGTHKCPINSLVNLEEKKEQKINV